MASHTRLPRRSSIAVVIVAALTAVAGRAAAQPAVTFTPDYSEPEEAAAKRVAARLKVGPSFGLAKRFPTQFSLEIDGAYAIVSDRLYATFSPQFNMGKGGILAFPIGVEYDIPIADVGPGKIVAYPRFNMGYARFTAGRGANAVQFAPELGAKWIYKDRIEAGVEPLSFAIYAGDDTAVAYRMYFYGGIRF